MPYGHSLKDMSKNQKETRKKKQLSEFFVFSERDI